MKTKLLKIIIITCLFIMIMPCIVEAADSKTTINLGDYVQMGTYYEDPILWRCVAFYKVDKDGNVDLDQTSTTCQEGYLPLMLSDKILCLKCFDAAGEDSCGSQGRGRGYYTASMGLWRLRYGSNYWRDSNIKTWLNSSDKSIIWPCWNPPAATTFRLYNNTFNRIWPNTNGYQNDCGFLSRFSQNERNCIKSVTQLQLLDKNEYYGIEGYEGKYTVRISSFGKTYHRYNTSIEECVSNFDEAYKDECTDSIFLLDVNQINQVYKNGDVLGSDYYIGVPTDKCVSYCSCSYHNSEKPSVGGKWYYWLRSPAANMRYDSSEIRCVSSNGSIIYDQANNSSIGIRPAFYLDLSSTHLISGDGSNEAPYTFVGTPNMTIDYANMQTNEIIDSTIEYKKSDDTEWTEGTDSRLSLEPETTYNFRVKGNESLEASLSVPKIPDAPSVTVNFAEETVNTNANQEYSLDDSEYWSYCSNNMNVSKWIGQKVRIRNRATTSSFPSLEWDTTLPERPESPSAPIISSAGTSSITLKAVDGNEYKCGSNNWQESNEFTGLISGQSYKFYQRVKATDEAFCSESSEETDASTVVENSGSCGTEASWSYDSTTGTLNINGSGTMTDYSAPYYAPWYGLRNAIRKVVFNKDITSVGNYSFINCTALQTCTLPDSLTDIGDYAFLGCSSLTTLNLPNSLEKIGNSSLYNCGVGKFVVPDKVTVIGSKAFGGTALKTLNIGLKADFSTECLYSCDNLNTVNISSKHANLKSVDGVVYSKDGKTLIFCPPAQDKTIVLESTVTNIGNHAFGGSTTKLQKVVFPASVTNVSDGAFCNLDSDWAKIYLHYCGTEEDINKITSWSDCWPDDGSGSTIHYLRSTDESPTCTNSGTTGGWFCDECSTQIIASTVLNALDHNYGEPTYEWNGTTCIAKRVCLRDATHVETEEAAGVYVMDTAETCTSAETGHYKAAFSKSCFTEQNTKKDSVTSGTFSGHGNWTYCSDGAVITATCGNSDCGHTETATVTIPDGTYTYDGSAKTPAVIEYSDGFPDKNLIVSYSNNTNAGIATAEISYSDVTAETTFTIDMAEIEKPSFPQENSKNKIYTYNGEIQTFLPVGFDEDTMTISGNLHTDANESGYIVNVTPKNNYKWSTEDDCEFIWIIEKNKVSEDKTQASSSIKETAESSTTIVLPEVPAGAVLGTVRFDGVTGVRASYDGTNLKVIVDDDIAENINNFTAYVPVKGSKNYKDFIITVSIDVIHQSVTIENPVIKNNNITFGLKLTTDKSVNITFVAACYDASGKMIGSSIDSKLINSDTTTVTLSYPNCVSENASICKIIGFDSENLCPVSYTEIKF